MGRIIESILFKGFVNKSLRVSYVFDFEMEGSFKVISENDKGNITMFPGYFIKIAERYPEPKIFISSTRYYTFIVLLEKTIKLIQENLFELFPGVGKIEFDMDSSVLERFQKEKALSSANITMVPALHTDGTGTCYPGIRISLNDKDSSVTIPLEDAIAMNQMFKTFEPNQYGLGILAQLIKIE